MDQPKILIVDDSLLIRKALSRQLEKLGAVVSQAEDGGKGLAESLSGSFDLIITDVEMPTLDGFALCEKLKEHPHTRGVPVIILSSLESDRDIEQGFRVGAAAYVSKSEAQSQLNETIERVLEKSRFHRGRLVLVVDDSLKIRELLSKALAEEGFQVITAENGKQALRRVEDLRPDLILSDIDMPEMNGIDLCKKIHADPVLATIPFVMMSANCDRAIMRRMLQWGAASYLIKPFNLEQVLITVEKLLSDHFLILLKERERLDSERKMMLASITSLIVALEARDQYTRGHSEAVAGLVAKMAAHMNADHEEIESLGIAGRLHDLGKIGVPDSILLKPGRLDAKEFAIIKEHPIIGASILGSIPSIKPLIPVILHHHERFDGKGYPSGLKGGKILLWARMTAVADTYHALISDRPYRKGMSQTEAMNIIEEVRGTQLCPDCVDHFKSLLMDMPKPDLTGNTNGLLGARKILPNYNLPRLHQ
jgi:putative two-component system response regulator